jgi:hypothetical protein
MAFESDIAGRRNAAASWQQSKVDLTRPSSGRSTRRGVVDGMVVVAGFPVPGLEPSMDSAPCAKESGNSVRHEPLK